MKTVLCILFTGGLFCSLSAAAADGMPRVPHGLGVGLEVGTIATVTVQKNMPYNSAVVVGAGSEWKDGVFYGDFLYYPGYPGKIGKVDLFFGTGGAIEFDKEDDEKEYEGLLRLVAGGSYAIDGKGTVAYGKVAPSFDLDGDSEMHFQTGLQYFF